MREGGRGESNPETTKIEREHTRAHACASEKACDSLEYTHTNTKIDNVQRNRQTDTHIPSWNKTHCIPLVFSPSMHYCTHSSTCARTHAHTHLHRRVHTHITTAQPHITKPSQSRTCFLGIHSGCVSTCATSSIFSVVV